MVISLPDAFRNDLVHRTFRGFLFILEGSNMDSTVSKGEQRVRRGGREVKGRTNLKFLWHLRQGSERDGSAQQMTQRKEHSYPL